MKPSSWRRAALLFAATVGIAAPLASTRATAVTYNFTNIADTTTAAPSGTFNGFSQGHSVPTGPAISGNIVAFGGQYVGGHGVFTGSGGAITTIAKTGDAAPVGTFNSIGSDSFGISGSTVAFAACYNNSNCKNSNVGIFTGSGASLTTIVKVGDPAPIGTFSELPLATAISGTTVEFAGTSGGLDGVFKSTGGTITQVFSTGGGIYAVGSRNAVSGGTVASQISYAALGPFGIITGSGGAITTIVNSGDPAPSGTFSGFGDGVAVSGSTAAFQGYYDGSQQGIFKGSGGSLTTIAKTGDPAPIDTFTSIGAYGFSISGASVAFSADYGNGTFPSTAGEGIFLGSGGALTTVIKTGDTLFGSTAQLLELGRFGLDPGGSGNLAFYYTLADGRNGIAVAKLAGLPGDYNGDGFVNAADYVFWRKFDGTPTGYATWRANFQSGSGVGSGAAVPEPSAGAMLAMFGAVSLLSKLVRRRSR